MLWDYLVRAPVTHTKTKEGAVVVRRPLVLQSR